MITEQLVKLKDKNRDELFEIYRSVEDRLKYNHELLFENYSNNSYYIGKYIYKIERIKSLLEYGHINIDVTDDLSSLFFEEEVICYKQIPILETYYNEHNSKIFEISEENAAIGCLIFLKNPKVMGLHISFNLKVPPNYSIS